MKKPVEAKETDADTVCMWLVLHLVVQPSVQGQQPIVHSSHHAGVHICNN
jgi:hypothetical protein